MPQSDFGPVNIVQGNQARFAIEFLDSNGLLTAPSSASLNVIYTTITNSSQTDSVTLTLSDSVWTGTWSSTSAARGLATWQVTATGSTSVVQTGFIRVIDP